MAEKRKVLLIGWDAADWKMIHPLMDAGKMPNVQKLVEGGTMANLRTLTPAFSPMLWTSIATGKRPFKHGILGFTEPTPDGKSVQPVTNLSRKTKAIWNMLQQRENRSLVVGWWPSHPVEPISGVMVSNNYQRAPKKEIKERNWPMAKGTVHPPELAATLADLRVHPLDITAEQILPFVPKGAEIDQSKDRRLDALIRIVADAASIQNCALHLLDSEEWDFAAVYFDAIDHFGHGFMKYHPPKQPNISDKDFDHYQNVVSTGYIYHDMMLGHLLEYADENTTVILMSDHGFHPDHLRLQAIPLEPAGPAAEHREMGIFVVKGPGIKEDHVLTGASLLDITPTILTLFGLPVGADMDGRPLLDIFSTQPEISEIPSWDKVSGEDGRHPPEKASSADEAKEQLEQLIALGYIERPDDNSEIAVANAQQELNYNEALAYIDAGLHVKAIPLLTQLYTNNPFEFRFGFQLALCLHGTGWIADLEMLLSHIKDHWLKAAKRAKSRLAEITLIKQQRKASRGETESETETDAEEKDKKPTEPLLNQNEQRVVKQLRFIAKGNPDTLNFLDSMILTTQKDYQGALEKLMKTEKPSSPGYYMKVGNMNLELGNLLDAFAAFQKVIELDPDNSFAYLGFCRCAIKNKEYIQAQEYAIKSIGLKHDFAPAHYFLGITLRAQNQLQKAIDCFEKALSLNPNFPEACSQIASVYKKLSKPKLAEDYEKRGNDLKVEHESHSEQRFIDDFKEFTEEEIDAKLPFLQSAAADVNLETPLGVKPDPTKPAVETDHFLTIVTGLPRSGTSMMMQVLDAAGMDIWADQQRAADDNNPRGYYEFDAVKRLNQDNAWIKDGLDSSKVLKVVAPLFPYLPQGIPYRVVVMTRNPDEIIASQLRMLERMELKGGKLSDKQLRGFIEQQLDMLRKILQGHAIPHQFVDYNAVLKDTTDTAEKLSSVLEVSLSSDQIEKVVDPSLYRERLKA